MTNSRDYSYRGKRALLLLRVSTEEQKKMYGFPSQESQIREKLLEPLGLKLDETRHIIKDTYTGLEFREREALNLILEMAKRHEFDVLLVDKLDRLGRKGLQREIYRAQLREYGVRILTTDPNEHADDDSLIGEMVRLLHGFKAQEEANDIKRRTMNGKRERAKNGKLLGAGVPVYGYTYAHNQKGEIDRSYYIPNNTIILVEEDGTEWTEVKVVTFIFQASASGRTLRNIAAELIHRGIPTRRSKRWSISSVRNMLRNTFYIGEAYTHKQRTLPKQPGRKTNPREWRDPDEQIKLPDGVVPALVDRETFEKVQKQLELNKQRAARNNPLPHESLLRSGLAKCGYCGGNLGVHREKPRPGHGKGRTIYFCAKSRAEYQGCKSFGIHAHILDDAAWEHALEIISDPFKVDQRIKELSSDDPTADRRKQIIQKLKEIKQEQATLRERLTKLNLDAGTEQFLSQRLQDLASQEAGYNQELDSDEVLYQRWKELQRRVKELHNFCAEMREKLSDPEYIAPYEKKREVCEFFGITARLWAKDHTPRFQVECNPPDIVSILACRSLYMVVV